MAPKKEKRNRTVDPYSDRRVFARMRAEVAFRCLGNDAECAGMTADISAQGVGLVSTAWLRPASKMEIYLKLPFTKEEFSILGKVVWCRKSDGKSFRIGLNLEKPELMIVSQLLAGLPRSS